MGKPGRKCTACIHADRALIETDIAGGEGGGIPAYAVVANRWGLSTTSLRRHVANHMAPAVRAALEPREGADPSTIVARALAVADAARSVRWESQRLGDHGGVLRGLDSEIKALSLLGSRLGISDETTVHALQEAKALALACGDAARTNSEVGKALAVALERRGAHEMAEALRTEIEREFPETKKKKEE